MTPTPNGGGVWWKNRLRSLLKRVRLGQGRKAIKRSIFEPPPFFKIQEKTAEKMVSQKCDRRWKNWLTSLFEPVRFNQVRIAIKSAITQNTNALIQSICKPLLVENSKEWFSKERPCPNQLNLHSRKKRRESNSFSPYFHSHNRKSSELMTFYGLALMSIRFQL